MPYFDRFDIALAYYHFTYNFPNADKALSRKVESYLTKWRFNPGLSDRNISTCNPNVKYIYMMQVKRYFNSVKVDDTKIEDIELEQFNF